MNNSEHRAFARITILLLSATLLSVPLGAHANPAAEAVTKAVSEVVARQSKNLARTGCALAGGMYEVSRIGRVVEEAKLVSEAEPLTETAKLAEAGKGGDYIPKELANEIVAQAEKSALPSGETIGETGILAISPEEAVMLAKQGYVPRTNMFSDEFIDDFAKEIDRLIDEGLVATPEERMVEGQPTEWIGNIGTIYGKQSDEILAASPLFRKLHQELIEFGKSYNAVREEMIASGYATAEEVPEIAAEAGEMNFNLVIGLPGHQFSGLRLHQDMTRFTAGLEAIRESSVYHTAVRARAFTMSGYARPIGPDGQRMNDIGGALPFITRKGAWQDGERGVLDIVPAYHNTGAFFFPHTTHAVARMPPTGSFRYSFQVFFPEKNAWEQEILPRIEEGELQREVESFLETGER